MTDERGAGQRSTATTGELSRGRRLAILLSCCVVVLCVQIDSTGVNLALPSISKDLGASTGELQWVVDAYLLVLASLLMFSGALADRIGRRRVLVAGLLTLPVAVLNGVMAYVSGWLTGRVGPRPPMVGGPLPIMAGAVILLANLGPTTAWGW